MKQACGCCAGIRILTPESGANRPGLSELAYRAGTYATFFESMVARLSSLSLNVPVVPGSAALTAIRPLARLTTREPDDAALALLDAWAVVADVLTFYQERIANEGYLGTAGERRSLLELARLIGYRARPGVSASVYLAFDAALDFAGTISKGARAQSIPGTGETAQFFETSDDLSARYVWNRLAPRVTRPQLITPPGVVVRDNHDVPLVTGADVVDAVYFRGTSTNLKPGDALLFVFNGEVDSQFLRHIEAVNVQGADARTEVTLQQLLPSDDVSAVELLLPFVEKASYLFPASDLAQEVAVTLNTLIANVQSAKSSAQAANLIRGVIPEVREKRDTALGRDFSRVTAWADHLLRTLEFLVGAALNGDLEELGEGSEGDPEEAPKTIFVPSKLAASPLGKLAALVEQLALPASVQPANSKQLTRSFVQSFSAQSDNAPRLFAALMPRVARKLYPAWAAAATPGNRVELHVPRVKASLFAHNFAGKPTVAQDGSTTFAAPTLVDAWGIGSTEAAPFVALDAAYDQIKPGSWVVIDRPDVTNPDSDQSVPGKRTYHRVTAVKTATMEAGANSGFVAKASVLTLEPPWLHELEGNADDIRLVMSLPTALRGTVVYAQTESLAPVEEPLDTDVQGNSIELARVYDGLEAGRWIIVSGERTDIPNVKGVSESELVMIAGVAQGAQQPLSVDFPLDAPPFSKVFYTTGANAFGDRLVVGQLATPSVFSNSTAGLGTPGKSQVPLPEFVNQQYREQAQLAPGFHVNAYVPTAQEQQGHFPDFAGLLVHPESGEPFDKGDISSLLKQGLFAWRITSQPLETVLSLAAPLAYKYDTRSIRIYGNVTLATHGQSSGEVLGDGDAGTAFQSFALRQGPLTHVSAPTPAGAESTLDVRVNEIEWHERRSLAALGPRDRCFITDAGDEGSVRTVFGNGERGARLPTGRGNVKAAYRYGLGKAGNVRAWQVSQLATHPLGVQGVQNPLPASGGADRDSASELRQNAPIAVMALDRLVSVDDYAAFARNYAGIGKASARRLSDGRRQLVHLTIAGKDDIPIDQSSELYRNLGASLARFGDPMSSVAVCVRRSKLLVISAGISLLPDYLWEAVEPQVRAAVLETFSFARRELGQPAFLSEAVAAMQAVEGVSYVNVERFDSVAESVTASELASLAQTLTLNHFVSAEVASLNSQAPIAADVCERVRAAELVFLTPDVPDTLLLKAIGA